MLTNYITLIKKWFVSNWSWMHNLWKFVIFVELWNGVGTNIVTSLSTTFNGAFHQPLTQHLVLLFTLSLQIMVCIIITITSPPKVIWKECIATPHGRECTRPLRVLAVQCPLRSSPVTQPRIHYIHTMIPHQSPDTSVPNHNLYYNPTYCNNPTTTAS